MRAASSSDRRVRSVGPAFCSVWETSITSKRVAHRVAQRLIHVGDQRLHALIHAPPDAHHHLRQPPRVHLFFHERAGCPL